MKPRKPVNLGAHTPKQFLKSYWQKKPLVVRSAFSGDPARVGRLDLEKLATKRFIESRLILEKGGTSAWEVRYGPFRKKEFDSLPKSHWTLLVQGVDQLLPAVFKLREAFSFIPQWRIDDVMVSYATRFGNVGAHVDNYDVFLIQGEGEREWQIENTERKSDDYKPNLDVRLLKKFKPDKRWILEPGDMLYLPPRFPHLGIARTDSCVTYSVGFRAPSHAELFRSYFSEQMVNVDEAIRYADPKLELQQFSGEISSAALKRIVQILRTATTDEVAIARWFGEFVTAPKDVAARRAKSPTVQSLLRRLKNGENLARSAQSRFAFAEQAGATILFVDGKSYPTPRPLSRIVRLLASKPELTHDELAPSLRNRELTTLLTKLIASGSLRLVS